MNTETTYKMEEVGAVFFVENKTAKTYEISEHYAGLVNANEKDYYISFRKLSELSKELFTVKISTEGINKIKGTHLTISLAHYVNTDGCDVLILKKAVDQGKDEALKAYIKQEESWVEIKSGLNQKLDEEAKFIEKEAKITFDQEIIDN